VDPRAPLTRGALPCEPGRLRATKGFCHKAVVSRSVAGSRELIINLSISLLATDLDCQ